MQIIADQKVCDINQSYPPGAIIQWDAAVPLPLGAGVRPADVASAAEVYAALRKQHAARIKRQEEFLKQQHLTPVQRETAANALNQYRQALADVPDVKAVAKDDKTAVELLS
jgi:hypothetical protein